MLHRLLYNFLIVATIIEGRGFHTVYLGKSHNDNILFALAEILCTAEHCISGGRTVRTFFLVLVYSVFPRIVFACSRRALRLGCLIAISLPFRFKKRTKGNGSTRRSYFETNALAVETWTHKYVFRLVVYLRRCISNQ